MKKPNVAFYFLLAVFGVLVGCTTTETAVTIAAPTAVQLILVSSDFAVGQPRVSFALFDGTNAITDVQSVAVVAFDGADENAKAVWSGSATPYTDYEVPYWVIYPDLPTAGYHGLLADITFKDGRSTQTSFILDVQEKTDSPALGDIPPASENRTVATEPDLSKLTSAVPPDPALYQMTVAEALKSGKPTVVGFATPGYCQTRWCAPVVQTMSTLNQEENGKVNFIHIEIYGDFTNLTAVPQVDEWGLTSEPWLFVLDKDGRLTAKLNGPVSPAELRTALESVLQ